MKRFTWLALAAFLGCRGEKPAVDAGVAAGPKLLNEQEPNDRPEQALVLDQSAIVSASLSADPSKPDEDWYLLTSPTPKTVDLNVSGIPGGDVLLEIYDIDRNRLVTVNSNGEGKPERLPNLGLKGRLYVRVTSAKKGAGGAYKLMADFKDVTPGFEIEPNDRAVDANPAVLGQPISGFIGHSADEDWFRYELPLPDGGTAGAIGATDSGTGSGTAVAAIRVSDGGIASLAGADGGGVQAEVLTNALKIELSAVDGVKFDLSVLSAAEAPLFQVRGKDNEGLSLRNVGVRSVDRLIYVVVKSAWMGVGKDSRRGFNADKPYVLNVGLEEAGANAELEPNDDMAHATPLPLNGFREGFLSPASDVDYYVLRTDRPVLAKVTLSGVERVDLVLSLVRPKASGQGEEVLLKSNDGAVKEPEMLNSVYCEKECYFKVEGALRKVDGKSVRTYENAEQPYRLSISTSPDNGTEEHEPNNTPETATPILIGKPIRGTIHPKRDLDYYRLDLSNKAVKTPIRATVTGILKVDIGLYLYELDASGRTTLVQTADRAKGDAPETIRYSAEPGVYVLLVKDTTKRSESNFQDYYQLTVEEGE
jgi:hypothetical protein